MAILLADTANIFWKTHRVFRGYAYLPHSLADEPVLFVIRPNELDIPGVQYIRKPEQIPAKLEELGMELPATLGLELDELPYSQAIRLQKVFPGAKVENVSVRIREARMIKTPREIKLIREDCRKHAMAYERIPKLYRTGMSDIEFQIEIERVLRQEGCLGYLRTYGGMMEINMGSVLNGANADVPSPYDFAVGGGGADLSLPVGADGEIMNPGTTVMVDMNGNFNGYQSDLTRTYAIGDLPQFAYHAHEVARHILRELEHIGVPGYPVVEMYQKAVSIARDHGLAEYFMGHRQQAGFIGHGVGIQLNEWPVIAPKSRHRLEEGMVIALEPKFVIPAVPSKTHKPVGAVGLENTYLVTADGLENLTTTPEEIVTLID